MLNFIDDIHYFGFINALKCLRRQLQFNNYRKLIIKHEIDRIEITQYDYTIYFKDSPEVPWSNAEFIESSKIKKDLRKLFGYNRGMR